MYNPIAPIRLARYQTPVSIRDAPNTDSSLTSKYDIPRNSSVKTIASSCHSSYGPALLPNLQLLPILIPSALPNRPLAETRV